MKAALLIADISDAQASFDAAAYKKAGHVRVRIKCTEGETFVAHTYAERVKASHAAGLAVDHYHFLHPGSGAAQADWFIAHLDLKSGDRLMADCEITGVNGQVVAEFIDRCHAKDTNVPGLIYGSPYFLRDNHIVSSHGWGLVLADYTTAKSPVLMPPGFSGVPFEWQYTETAHTAGISGGSDLSRVVRAVKQPKKRKNLSSWLRKVVDWTITAAKRRKKNGSPLSAAAEQRVDRAIAALTDLKGLKQ